MKGNKSYIHQATKKAERNHDAPKLDYIQKNSQVKWFREIPVFHNQFSTQNHMRVPDLAAQTNSKWIILEHDTSNLHGELGFEREKTIRRNEDYVRTRMPFFVINQDLCKILCLDQAKLSTYLYYHTLSQIKAGLWNETNFCQKGKHDYRQAVQSDIPVLICLNCGAKKE